MVLNIIILLGLFIDLQQDGHILTDYHIVGGARLQAGDIILEINRESVEEAKTLQTSSVRSGA